MTLFRTLLLIAVALAASAPVQAQKAGTKAEAALLAQQKHGGQVLKVELQNQRYKVKILQNSGRVISIMIDKKDVRQQHALTKPKGQTS